LRIFVGGFLSVCLLTAGAPHAFAQQPPDGLNEQQRLGRQVLAQSCGVCHLPPARNARTYGPALNKGTLGGDDGLVRKVIGEGTPRMPAFKYFLQPTEVDAIIAFIRTVPAPAPTRGSAVLPEEAPPPRRAEPTP
jgi:mono/diheme cytochrome c family protein